MKASEFETVIASLNSGPEEVDDDIVEYARRFLNPLASLKRYVIGRNAESEFLRQIVQLEALIDDRAPSGSTWQSLPVVAMNEVPKDAWVLNTSTSIAPVAVNRALRTAGLTRSLNLADLISLPEAPPTLVPWFVKEQRSELHLHREHWVRLYEHLDDAESKQVLQDVLGFRLTANPKSMEKYSITDCP